MHAFPDMELIGIGNMVHDRRYRIVAFAVLFVLIVLFVPFGLFVPGMAVMAVIVVLRKCRAHKAGEGQGQCQYAELLDVHFHYSYALVGFA